MSILSLSLFSCKNENKDINNATIGTVNTDTKRITGDYIFLKGVAMFNTNEDGYAVIENDLYKILNKKADSINGNYSDFVTVIADARIVDNPAYSTNKEVWPKAIEFVKIIAVSPLITNIPITESN